MLGGVAPVVTAHRGYSAAAPENTLPAFQLAIDQGCEWAELDVQMTRDGVVMVTHDTSPPLHRPQREHLRPDL